MKNITKIKDEHLIKCSELFTKVFNNKPWNDKWTLETASKRLNDIFVAPNFEGVVYIEEDEIKGAIFGNYEQYYDGIHYNLKELFISNEIQGTGIGSKLIAELERRLKEIGVTAILLFTSKGNGTNNFYLKNNFMELSEMVIMGKQI